MLENLLWYLLERQDPIGHEHRKVLLFANPSITHVARLLAKRIEVIFRSTVHHEKVLIEVGPSL
jgi:hypothetical protein